jgi:hypothetical protein
MYSSGMVFGNTNGHAGTTYHVQADSNTWDDSAIINVSATRQAGQGDDILRAPSSCEQLAVLSTAKWHSSRILAIIHRLLI